MSGQASAIDQLVRQKFSVKESFVLPGDEAEYRIEYDEGTKGKFDDLTSEVSLQGYRPELTGTSDECVLMLRKIQPAPVTRSRLPVLLALFTLASVVVFSILQELVDEELLPSLPGYLVLFGFGGSIAAVIGAHELAQRLSARRRGGGHAVSYLIPGIPFITSFLPSLGFVASQRQPALNRDRLFDTVIAGPLAIVLLATLFYAIGDVTAVQSSVPFAKIELANSTVTINSNAIQVGIDAALSHWLPVVSAGHVAVSPVADGATISFLLAFIALLPMATFDGGLLTSIAWGSKAARVTSYLSVLGLLVIDTPNYWALAVVVLLLAGRPSQLKVLDEVSRLSSSRQWLLIGLLVLAFLCLPIPKNLATFPLP